MVRLGIILLLTTGVLMWIPVLGWVTAPITFVAGVIFLLAGIGKGDL